MAGEQSGPRIVDCPIDTILGEIKGEASLTRVLPAPAIKHIFVPDKFPTSKSYFYFACIDKNLDFSFCRRIVRFRLERKERERERNGSRKRKEMESFSQRCVSVYRENLSRVGYAFKGVLKN